MDQRFLQTMYQQWSHGMSNAGARWLDFVEMAAKQTGSSQLEIMNYLQRCSWFNYVKD